MDRLVTELIKGFCLIFDKHPQFSVAYRKSVQMTVLFSNHPSSFALKQPVISLFVVASTKKTHTHPQAVTSALLQEEKKKKSRERDTHTHTELLLAHICLFYHILLRRQYTESESTKKIFHCSVLFTLWADYKHWERFTRRVLDLSYRQCEWGNFKT